MISRATPTIDIADCWFSYHRTGTAPWALAGVTLRTNASECLAFIGHNGAGKSTLLKMLIGIIRPTLGKVIVAGKDTTGLTISALSRNVAYAFQNPGHQLFGSSVIDDILFGPKVNGEDPLESTRLADELLELLGLAEDRDANPYDLPFAKRKLVTLASALLPARDIVVLDEPTLAQDERSKEAIGAAIARKRSQGATVILVTHDLTFAMGTADRIVAMKDGRIHSDGPPNDVLRPSILEDCRLRPSTLLELCWLMGITPLVRKREELPARLLQGRSYHG